VKLFDLYVTSPVSNKLQVPVIVTVSLADDGANLYRTVRIGPSVRQFAYASRAWACANRHEPHANMTAMMNQRFRVLALILIGWMLGSCAQGRLAAASGPEGNWLTAQGGAVVQIAACTEQANRGQMGRGQTGRAPAGRALSADALCGRLVGIKLNRGARMPRDYMGQSQCGFPLLQPAVPSGTPGVWRGHIVDPRNGHVYQATLRLTPNGRLALHGYLLLPVLGETQYWTRYTAPVPRSCRIMPALREANARR
jgi:uncharacterized protein (DUF2147 family)